MRVHRVSDVLSVSIRYTYTRDGYFYFQRAVPDDLRQVYGKRVVKQALKTTSPEIAARKVARLNASLEAEWQRLRSDPRSAPASLTTHAEVLLDSWSLRPKGEGRNDPEAVDLFRSHLDDGHEGWVEELPPVQRKAVELLYKGKQPTLGDALTFYLERHKRGADEAFAKLPRLCVEGFVSSVGDKAFSEITRDDVRKWMDEAVEKGASQGTIQRRLNALNAISAFYIREKELDIPNRFSSHTIPAAAKEAEKRKPFTVEELKAVQKECKAKDDDMRHLVAMLSDTCSRLAEIAGLRLKDIVLDHDVPHIRIEDYPGRSLKTRESVRSIPLVGVALWAAQRVVTRATKHQIYAFPRYMKGDKCQANAASASLNKWLVSLKLDHTTHEFRHAMADRLREVGCPEEIRKQVGGWARDDLSAKYGDGYSLKVMHEWLRKVVVDSDDASGRRGD